MADPATATVVRRPKVKFSSEVMFVVSVIFCVCLAAIYLSRYFMIRGLMAREIELQQKIEVLERENRSLKRNLDNLSTAPGVEHLARERLGLVKPNEFVVVPVGTMPEILIGTAPRRP